jgi:hypothetical protein
MSCYSGHLSKPLLIRRRDPYLYSMKISTILLFVKIKDSFASEKLQLVHKIMIFSRFIQTNETKSVKILGRSAQPHTISN